MRNDETGRAGLDLCGRVHVANVYAYVRRFESASFAPVDPPYHAFHASALTQPDDATGREKRAAALRQARARLDESTAEARQLSAARELRRLIDEELARFGRKQKSAPASEAAIRGTPGLEDGEGIVDCGPSWPALGPGSSGANRYRLRNKQGARDAGVERHEFRIVRRGEGCEMSVRRLLRSFHPRRQRIGIDGVGQKDMPWPRGSQLGQCQFRLPNVRRGKRRLERNTHESQLGDGTSRDRLAFAQSRPPNPRTVVMGMVRPGEREQHVHVGQIRHGKSASVARTQSEVSGGVPGGT